MQRKNQREIVTWLVIGGFSLVQPMKWDERKRLEKTGNRIEPGRNRHVARMSDIAADDTMAGPNVGLPTMSNRPYATSDHIELNRFIVQH